MKFKVRKGFVVHHERIVEIDEDGVKVKQPQVTSFYGDQVAELTTDEATRHLHKLEPTCAEGRAFLASKHVRIDGQVAK
jgi:hypothetical protein